MLDANLKPNSAPTSNASRSRSRSSPRSTTRRLRPSCANCCKDIADASPLITVTETRGGPHRTPSFSVNRPGETRRRRALPACPWATSSPRWCWRCCRSAAIRPRSTRRCCEQIRDLDGDFEFEIYISLTCHNCPDVVQALNLMAVQNPRIKTTMIDGALFQDEVKERQIMAVPTVFLNGTHFGQGRMSLEEILAKIDTGARRARGGEARRKGPVRRADRRRRPRRRRGRGVRGAQGHPHRRRVRALRRPGAGHAGHRELHLGQGNRRARSSRSRWRSTCATTTSTS